MGDIRDIHSSQPRTHKISAVTAYCILIRGMLEDFLKSDNVICQMAQAPQLQSRSRFFHIQMCLFNTTKSQLFMGLSRINHHLFNVFHRYGHDTRRLTFQKIHYMASNRTSTVTKGECAWPKHQKTAGSAVTQSCPSSVAAFCTGNHFEDGSDGSFDHKL